MAKAGQLNNNLLTAIQSVIGCHMLEASYHGAVSYIGDTDLVLAAMTWNAEKHKGNRLFSCYDICLLSTILQYIQ